ncbi:hypothetical protein MIR68_002457 [Amoeboaphelidium protococcarum]|nr:hypothetical protein MIR68_002457 [Amoeboaphelidium protococcarum]
MVHLQKVELKYSWVDTVILIMASMVLCFEMLLLKSAYDWYPEDKYITAVQAAAQIQVGLTVLFMVHDFVKNHVFIITDNQPRSR